MKPESDATWRPARLHHLAHPDAKGNHVTVVLQVELPDPRTSGVIPAAELEDCEQLNDEETGLRTVRIAREGVLVG